ncbi:MAG TPA: hypothetical protein VIP46_04960 [Pyrinomonadaceae bacterium]
MARIRIPKNAGQFRVERSMAFTPIVTNGKSGGNRITIPCKSWGQAAKLCEKLNSKDRPAEVWM